MKPTMYVILGVSCGVIFYDPMAGLGLIACVTLYLWTADD